MPRLAVSVLAALLVQHRRKNHPFLLDSRAIFDQRMDYLHENPIRAGFVYQPQDWLYAPLPPASLPGA